MCGEMEQMLESTDGRAVGRLLDQAGKAFEQIGKVPGDERAALSARYDDVRARLVIRVKELREAEDWQRWANVPRAEGLIAEARALAEAEAPTLPQLKELQKRWKTVGQIPQKKSKELWETFKASCDAAYVKIKGAREAEKAQWGENAAARERLIAEADGLADSTEWDATANRLKAMQAEWKQLGPVPRKQGDALWKKFRAACDRFFERRKPMLEARNAELIENLERKQALCAKVEALVEGAPGEGGWGAAIKAVKAAQRDWKDIGFVPRRDADAIYARFRAACDGLFDKRDDARDAEAEALRAEVEAVRGTIEAVLAGDGGAAQALEVHRTLRGLAERDLRPSAELAALYDKMVREVAAAAPAELAGTELDPAAMERRRDKAGRPGPRAGAGRGPGDDRRRVAGGGRRAAARRAGDRTPSAGCAWIATRARSSTSCAPSGRRSGRSSARPARRWPPSSSGPAPRSWPRPAASARYPPPTTTASAAGGGVVAASGAAAASARPRSAPRRRSPPRPPARPSRPSRRLPRPPPEVPTPAPEVPQVAPEVPATPEERPEITPVEVPAPTPAPAPGEPSPEVPPMLATAPAEQPAAPVAAAPTPAPPVVPPAAAAAPPTPAPPVVPPAAAAATEPEPEPAASPRKRSITEAPPSDPVDDAWD